MPTPTTPAKVAPSMQAPQPPPQAQAPRPPATATSPRAGK